MSRSSGRTMQSDSAAADKVLMMGRTNTLTPHVSTYMDRRRRLHTYSPKSLAVVGPRLRTLDASFGRRPIEHLNQRAIERWLEGLEHLATNSRAAYLGSARQFTRWLAAEGVVRVDPCASLPTLPRARAVPRAQTEDAVAAIFGACRSPRERAIVWLMVGMGLRRMEVAGLRWEHYDTRDARLLVFGKGSKERLLPVPERVARSLEEIHEHTSGPIIRSQADGFSPVQPATIGSIVHGIITRAGVKRAAYDGVSGHALRHTAASDVLDRCGDLRKVQAMLGHENLTSTAIYLRLAAADELREAMEGRRYDDAA